MQGNTIRSALTAACAGVLLAACNDDATSPTLGAARPASAAVATTALPDAFLIRAPLDAFFINQMPEMMIRSNARTDFVIQRLVTPPEVGRWHTHTGPSFGIVDQGAVTITRYTKKDGCVSTTYGPGLPAGRAYFEVANEVHRATVLGPGSAVEYKARFYAPVDGAFTDFDVGTVPVCS